jgi:hypothetical protein
MLEGIGETHRTLFRGVSGWGFEVYLRFSECAGAGFGGQCYLSIGMLEGIGQPQRRLFRGVSMQ